MLPTLSMTVEPRPRMIRPTITSVNESALLPAAEIVAPMNIAVEQIMLPLESAVSLQWEIERYSNTNQAIP